MKITMSNFKDFIYGSWDYSEKTKEHCGLWLRQEEMDIGGGRISKDDIDKLKKFPEVGTLTISGLNQDTFEYFINTYGKQLRAVRFFKNKLVSDWSLLGNLPQLEFVYFFHNQKIDSLWDMSKNISLKGLMISDFTRLKTLAGIEKAPNLEWFGIGDAIWSTSVVDSFKYFKGTKIKYLSFFGKKIEDDDLSFISDMKYLEEFDFPTNLYSTEQVAWIVANFPKIKGFALKSASEYMGYDNETGKSDIPTLIIIGKRKPHLVISKNEEKIKKYVDNFQSLIKKFEGVPYAKIFAKK
ncbi:MAG: hypothetical protein ACM3O4_01980 [Ignavibacteriales bacterium]